MDNRLRHQGSRFRGPYEHIELVWVKLASAYFVVSSGLVILCPVPGGNGWILVCQLILTLAALKFMERSMSVKGPGFDVRQSSAVFTYWVLFVPVMLCSSASDYGTIILCLSGVVFGFVYAGFLWREAPDELRTSPNLG